jgi:hypothetical protein
VGFLVTVIVGYGTSFVLGTKPAAIDMYTLIGQKQHFINNRQAEAEGRYYVIPGKFERNSYLLIVYFCLVVAALYALGR